MAGGLFAIDRQYFQQLGTYDSGMNIWGAENIVFSLRVSILFSAFFLVEIQSLTFF